jgi:hypothetical protein
MADARRNQYRPAPGPAADIQPHAAAGRQQMPGKNTEIIVEYRLALLAREMIYILAERRPFLTEAAGNPKVEIVICVCGHIRY